MKVHVIKISFGLLLIGLGYICIRFGDKQFGKYNNFTKLLCRRFLPNKNEEIGDKIMGWLFGIVFIAVGVLIIFV